MSAWAMLAGHPIQSDAAYWYALAFTLGGAAVFALSRLHAAPVPQEAIIGIVYAVSAAVAVLVVDRAPQGSEYIKQLLVGSILTVLGVHTLTAGRRNGRKRRGTRRCGRGRHRTGQLCRYVPRSLHLPAR